MTKVKISVAVDEEILKWVDEKIKSRYFANRSHAVEAAFALMMEMQEAFERSPDILAGIFAEHLRKRGIIR